MEEVQLKELADICLALVDLCDVALFYDVVGGSD